MAFAELVYEEKPWTDEQEGSFFIVPFTVGHGELDYPDEQWESLVSLYIRGYTHDLRERAEAWYAEQRAARKES